MDQFKLVSRSHPSRSFSTDFLREEAIQRVRAFHSRFPMYAPTPLAQLPRTAAALGLGEIYVKDESYRFGLNAFKVLGGSYAIGRILAERLQLDSRALNWDILTAPATQEQLGKLTFVTATDGNHGRGVAWAAKRFGHRSVVYMPKGTARERLENILAEGSDACITEMNYDDAVRHAAHQSETQGWLLVQDTTQAGYETVPRWIMQGYGTMGLEAIEQLPKKPTHVFLQAGVGSMAGAIAGLFASVYGSERPIITVVEPNAADCHYRTALADDGLLHSVTGQMETIMAGLACGEPCSLSWEILSACADHFISCPDYAAAKGMRMLAAPVSGDDRLISGESGASAFGCIAEIMMNPSLARIKEALQLDASSRLLFFSTEGDTDAANYRAVVWDGRYPSFHGQ